MRQFSATSDFQFSIDRLEILFYGVFGKNEFLRDFEVLEATSNQLCDLTLSRCETAKDVGVRSLNLTEAAGKVETESIHLGQIVFTEGVGTVVSGDSEYPS